MEVLAVIGLTANILQFMDVAWDIFKLGNEVRCKGHDSVRDFNHFNHDPSWTACKMREFATQLSRRQFPACDNEAEETLNQISDECVKIAKELASIMDSLDQKYRAMNGISMKGVAMNKIAKDSPIQVFKSWKFAIKLLREQDHIKELSEKLEKCRGLLSSSVLIHVLKRMDELLLEQRRVEKQAEAAHQNRHETTLSTLESYAVETRQYFTDIKTRFVKFEDLITNKPKERPVTKYPPIPAILASTDPSLRMPAMSLEVDRRIEANIVGNLAFLMMDDREKKVKRSFQETFSWIFRQNLTEGPDEVNFNEWLQNRGGMYWITGKAGSGKSTLMKFLRNHSQTRGNLKVWAGSDDLVIASYFCWAAGSDLQKNQEGLLRALLYQIVKARPDLMSVLFPRRYEAIMNHIFEANDKIEIFFQCERPSCTTIVDTPGGMIKHLKKAHGIETTAIKEQTSRYSSRVFPLSELETAFENLSRIKLSRIKIALMVDGLDEYQGDQGELIKIFDDVTRLPYVKAVVSSRPETLFTNAFDSCPFIRMDNLTREDMLHYVRVTLGGHHRMKRLEDGEPGFLEAFAQQVTTQSNGVFLWTALAVGQLKSALDDGCFADELRGILNNYPEELHDLYCHMFQRMKSQHRGEGYRLLRCAQYGNDSEGQFPSLLRFWFIVSESPGSSVTAKGQLMDRLTLKNNLELAATRVKSRCCGLLECTLDSSEDYYEGTVTPFHRTISDFLADGNIKAMMMEEMVDGNATDWLLESIIWCLKKKWSHRTTTHEDWRKLRTHVNFAMAYVQDWARTTPSKSQLIDSIDDSMQSLWGSKDKVLRMGANTSRKAFGSFESHWSQALLPTAFLKRTEASRHHPLAWLALCHSALDVLRERVLTQLHFWDEGWGYVFAKLICLQVYEDCALESSVEIIRAMANKSTPSSNPSNKSSKGPFWSRSAWEILLFLQPLAVNAGKLPADMRELAIKNDDQVRAFERWATIVNILIDEGSPIDHRCTWVETDGGLETVTSSASKLVEDAISSYKMAQASDGGTKDMCNVVNQLEIALKEHADTSETGKAQQIIPSKARCRNKTYHRRRKGHNSENSAGSSSIGSLDQVLDIESTAQIDPKQLRGASMRNTDNGSSIISGPSIESSVATREKISSSGPCSTCQAVRELRGMFEAPDILDAVENAGLSPNTTSLANWILNRQAPTQGINILVKAKGVQKSDPGKGRWAKVMTSKPSNDVNKGVPGASFVTESGKKMKKRRPKKEPQPAETVGTIQVGNRTLKWSIEEGSGLLEHEESLLKDVLAAVLSNG